QPFISIRWSGKTVAAAAYSKVYESTNSGKSWDQVHIPLVSYISSMTLDGNGYVWLNSPQGVFRQVSDGWEKTRDLPQDQIAALDFDSTSNSVVAVNRETNAVLESADGHHWRSVFNPGVPVKSVIFTGDQVFAGTKFDGVVRAETAHVSQVSDSEVGGGK
ncbi:MAG TPA: hypothetical protein VG897_00310, partial [Terriglobales bacterium]|nr:hypothetical protein [Terriglobales bacterium]